MRRVSRGVDRLEEYQQRLFLCPHSIGGLNSGDDVIPCKSLTHANLVPLRPHMYPLGIPFLPQRDQDATVLWDGANGGCNSIYVDLANIQRHSEWYTGEHAVARVQGLLRQHMAVHESRSWSDSGADSLQSTPPSNRDGGRHPNAAY